MDDFLFKLIHAAREEMEAFAKLDKVIGGDPNDLCCYCAISSHFLRVLARYFGYRLTVVEGSAFEFHLEDQEPNDLDINHCWIEYHDHIIDITATQFGIEEKVYTTSIDDNDYWPIVMESTSVSLEDWPFDQSPVTFKAELRERARKLARNLVSEKAA